MQQKNIFADTSLWTLLLSNLVTIFLAITEQWSLNTIMWVYWFQSMIIGVFNFIRILGLKEFSTENFRINGSPVEPTEKTKRSTAFFFLFHYSGFHFVYFLFLMSNALDSALTLTYDVSSGAVTENTFRSIPATAISSDLPFIAVSTLGFLANHYYSFRRNNPHDTARKLNIGALMFYPYARIFPMHLTILLGATTGVPLLMFLVLKTIADGVMHVVEHRVLMGEKK